MLYTLDARPALRLGCLHLVQALCFCHAIGIAHRDVKPENLLFFRKNASSCFKLADFGAAALTKAEPVHSTSAHDKASDSVSLRRMVSSRPIGSTQFVPPEIATLIYAHSHKLTRPDIKYDAYAVDVWSYGVSVFHMAAGCPPFSFAHSSDRNFVAFCAATDQLYDMRHSKSTPSTCVGDAIWTWPSHFSDALVNLLSMCMQIEGRTRPSIHQVSQHPWLSSTEASSVEITSVSATEATVAVQQRAANADSVAVEQASRGTNALAWLDDDQEIIQVVDSPVESETNAAVLEATQRALDRKPCSPSGRNSPETSIHPMLHATMQPSSQGGGSKYEESVHVAGAACHSDSHLSMLRTHSALSPGGSFITTSSSRVSTGSTALSSSRISARYSAASSSHSLLRHQSMRSSYASFGSFADSNGFLPPIMSNEQEERLSRESASPNHVQQRLSQSQLDATVAPATFPRIELVEKSQIAAEVGSRIALQGETFGKLANSQSVPIADFEPATSSASQSAPTPRRPAAEAASCHAVASPKQPAPASLIKRLLNWKGRDALSV